ncbi:hypothetical protein F5887DRAFT_1081488 [Amanita rubescens]|nr:hypothetical protein F5887DRAFT_1081488 [Amanita rubescens]
MLSYAEAYIIAVTVQALLMGAYFVSFLICLRWLVFSDDGGTLRKGINWTLLSIAIILFALSVADLCISVHIILLVSEGHSVKAYTSVITCFIEMLTRIITDGVLIFRCWIVYNRSWRIVILPLLLLLYNICLLITTVHWSINMSGGNPPDPRYGMIWMSYYASTIVINIYATSAIILKIWRNSFSRRLSHFAIRVIAESGLLYTLTSIAVFCASLRGAHITFLVTNAINFPASIIAFNLILIRVAENRANPEPEQPTFIGNSTIERAIPAVQRHQPESVAS